MFDFNRLDLNRGGSILLLPFIMCLNLTDWILTELYLTISIYNVFEFNRVDLNRGVIILPLPFIMCLNLKHWMLTGV